MNLVRRPSAAGSPNVSEAKHGLPSSRKSGVVGDSLRRGKPGISKARTEKVQTVQTESTVLTGHLVAAGSHQDREAFRLLFDHFAPRLKSFMLRRGADDGLAEEVVQEAMINVWRKARLFDPSKASASTWIFTIGRNVHIDLVRRAKRPELDPEDPELAPAALPEATAEISREQDAQLVRNAMKDLSDEQKEVLRMAFFEEKPHRDIAEELNIPLGTVKSRIRLAFKRMRDELDEDE